MCIRDRNHYGGDMVNSLTQAVQFGLRDKQVNGKDFTIIVPLYSELMAAGAGANIQGVFGSMNWNWQLQDEGTKAFVKSFGESTASHHPTRRTHATFRHCFTQMRPHAPGHSTHVPSPKRLKTSNLTVWATVRRCTVATTISVSKTSWS